MGNSTLNKTRKCMDNNNLIWLIEWYQSHCDGDWEHDSSVHIGTIDNPVWTFSVNLEDTELEMKKFTKFEIERSEDNWLVCFIRDKKFEGRCGSGNLLEVLQIFREWVDS